MWTKLRFPVSNRSLYCISHPPTCCSVLDFSSYIPHSFAPAVGYIRTFVTTIFGRNSHSIDAAEVSRVRQSLSNAENSLREAEDKLRNAQRDLEDLFKRERFGKDGEWKKLDGLCLEKDTGEYVQPAIFLIHGFLSFPRYTYEVCLFGEARQKANSGGSAHSLGHFSSWKIDQEVGTPDYYSRQIFTGGVKCWNGPQRSVQACIHILGTGTLIHVLVG